MYRYHAIAAALTLFAFAAAAQTPPPIPDNARKVLQEKIVKMDMVGAVKGPVVKGLPYSADEITETNQVLADGTRIHRETKTTVYRDSEGRTRRETPDAITISDPAAGSTWVVNPKTNSVRKLQTTNTFIYRDSVGAGGGEQHINLSVRSADGQAEIEVNGKPLDPKAVAELMARAKTEGSAEVKGDQVLFLSGPDAVVAHKLAAVQGDAEALGQKNFDGVIAQGTRHTTTIETGVVGNDRPIQVVSESWYSDELRATVYTLHNDPRTGEEIFRVTNIHRGEPPADLFQPPADPHAGERKM